MCLDVAGVRIWELWDLGREYFKRWDKSVRVEKPKKPEPAQVISSAAMRAYAELLKPDRRYA